MHSGCYFSRTMRVRAQPSGGSTEIATDWGEKMTYRNALALAAMTAAVLAVGAARAEDYGPLQVIEAASGKVLADPKGMKPIAMA